MQNRCQMAFGKCLLAVPLHDTPMGSKLLLLFSSCATTGDAATGAEVRPVRASGVAVMVARTTRDGDAAASCSETSSCVGVVCRM